MIVLDIDGVVANSDDELNTQLDLLGYDGLIPSEEWAGHKWSHNYDHIPQQILDDVMYNPLFATNAIPYESAWYFINHYCSYHKITLLTARPVVLESATWQWVLDWDIQIDDIIFEKNKIEVLADLKPDIFVDDLGPTVEEARAAGFNAVLLNKKYNQDANVGDNRINDLWEIKI